MTRRKFFSAMALGGASLPGALATTSTPIVPGVLTVSGYMSGVSGFFSKVVMMPGSTLTNSMLSFPWTTRNFCEGRGPARITNNYFKVAIAPLWARLLRMNRG